MEKSLPHNGLKKWIIRLGWGMIILLLFVTVFRFSLTTEPVRNWAKNYAVNTINGELHAEVDIQKISGDLWNDIRLEGIHLADKDTIVTIDSIQVSYSVWSYFSDQFTISHLNIYKPVTYLEKKQDQWNVQGLIKPSSDTSSAVFPFRIDDLSVNKGQVNVEGDSLDLTTPIEIADIQLKSNISIKKSEIDLDLQALNFQLNHIAVGKKAAFESAATVQDEQLTLEKLLLTTGKSTLRSSGSLSLPDSTIRLDLSTDPLSFEDLLSYRQDFALKQDIEAEISLTGSSGRYRLGIQARAKDLQDVNAEIDIKWKSGLVLEGVRMQANHFDLQQLSGDSTLPAIEKLDLEFAGRVAMADYQQGYGDLELSIDQLENSSVSLEQFKAEAQLGDREIMVDLSAEEGQQRLSSSITVQEVWGQPNIDGKVRVQGINPRDWFQNEMLDGEWDIASTFSGSGWYPESSPWEYDLSVRDRSKDRQYDTELSLSGQANMDWLTAEGELNVRNGLVALNANLHDIRAQQNYDFQVEMSSLDLGKVLQIDSLETSLNGVVSGGGSGLDPSEMQLNLALAVDSSTVNNEPVDRLEGTVSIRNTVAEVKDINIESRIADGTIKGRWHLVNRFDPANRFNADLQIKDIGSLAPLLGLTTAEAKGSFYAEVGQSESNNLEVNGTIDLSNIVLDDLLTAEQARGNFNGILKEQSEYFLDINLMSPTFTDHQLQDVWMQTQGNIEGQEVDGDYEVRFSGPAGKRLEQKGQYFLSEDSTKVQISEFDIVSSDLTLSLEDPFAVDYSQSILRVDTMRMVSAKGAFIELAIPYADSIRQEGTLRGKDMNLTPIQEVLLKESYVDGVLSAEARFERMDTTILKASGNMVMSDLSYRELHFDSISLEGTIEQERLNGRLLIQDKGDELIQGKADLPFQLADPENLPDRFFNEPVNGELMINAIAMDRLQPIFDELGLTQSGGILTGRADLSGTAGTPQFSAGATLHEAVLSGVELDSVTAGLTYDHTKSLLNLQGSIQSLKQTIVELETIIPFHVDFRTFEIAYPEKDDPISANITTKEFNLAALNDFLDNQEVRDLQGSINGNIMLSGPVDSLETHGAFTLRKGSIRLVPLGIRLDDMHSDIHFENNQIRITEFRTRSGKGRLNISGTTDITAFTPADMDIRLSAQNFRMANTNEMNAIVNADMRLQGRFYEPVLSGNLAFVSGFYELQNFGERSVESISLDSTEQHDYRFSVYDSLSMDMNISFNDRFFLRNRQYLDMEMELDGSLDMVKDKGKDLQLFGTMNTSDGYARPLGKMFAIEEGSVIFSGSPTNPQLSVRSMYSPPQTQEEIKIWYLIEGTVEDPKFKYESQPPMELENILSYTLFGQPFYALDSWQQVVTGSGNNTSATTIALDVLLDRVESLATRRLGIDVVRIDNATAGGQTGTSVTTGWYINPKVFFAIQNVVTGSTPNTSFQLEYLLRENLKLMLRQGNGIREGIDLKWNHDY